MKRPIANATSANAPKTQTRGKRLSPEPRPASELLRNGKDEMNLAEHPFALVRYGDNPGALIEYSWPRRLDTGKEVIATWRVSGDPELGLPGPSDECLYLALMELTRESGMQQVVHFSRYDLLKRLGWTICQRNYELLDDCFTRLKAVSIRAENCFWDANSKSHLGTVGFSLLDNYKIKPEAAGRKEPGQVPESYFRWNDVVFQSIQDGNIRDLAIGFALSLRNPTARRLFRYLDMKRYDGKGSYQIGLHKLSDHLGMVGLEYTSKIKERLGPAHKELSERGFLEKVLYLPMRTEPGEEKVIYSFGNKLLPPGKKRKIPQTKTSRTKASSIDATAHKDGEILAAACDAVLEALPEAKRRELEQTIMAGWMPEMIERLQDPNSLAAREHRRLLRQVVEREYPKEVQASLKKS